MAHSVLGAEVDGGSLSSFTIEGGCSVERNGARVSYARVPRFVQKRVSEKLCVPSGMMSTEMCIFLFTSASFLIASPELEGVSAGTVPCQSGFKLLHHQPVQVMLAEKELDSDVGAGLQTSQLV